MMSKLLAKAGADATVLTQTDSVAWAFNIRGADVPYTPVVLAYAIVKKKGKAELFIDKAKLPEDVAAHLKKSVIVKKPDELETSLKALGKSVVQIDNTWAPSKIKSVLGKAKIILGETSITNTANKIFLLIKSPGIMPFKYRSL